MYQWMLLTYLQDKPTGHQASKPKQVNRQKATGQYVYSCMLLAKPHVPCHNLPYLHQHANRPTGIWHKRQETGIWHKAPFGYSKMLASIVRTSEHAFTFFQTFVYRFFLEHSNKPTGIRQIMFFSETFKVLCFGQQSSPPG